MATQLLAEQRYAADFDPPGRWQSRAACVDADPELFYAHESRPAHRETERAKLMCAGCPVRTPCLASALARREPHGIWGGLTADERARVRPLQLVR